jgi:hypothetical protein
MEAKEIVDRYKKGSMRTALIFMIAVIILGLAFLAGGIVLIIYSQDVIIIVLSSIMFLASILNITLAIRYYFFTKKRLKNISDREAIDRYNRIHGTKIH